MGGSPRNEGTCLYRPRGDGFPRYAPDPAPRDGEHLIRVDSVGICGSDMHAYLGHDARRPAPLILGHEAAGVIVGGPRKMATGSRSTRWSAAAPARPVSSGRENLCPTRQIISMPPREGAFAQFDRDACDSNLVTVPDNVPFAKAALAEPLAVSWHAVRLGLEALNPAAERTRAGDRRRGDRSGRSAGAAGDGGRRRSPLSNPTIPAAHFLKDQCVRKRRCILWHAPRDCRRCRGLCRHPRLSLGAGATRWRDRSYRAGRRYWRARYPPHDPCKRSLSSAPIPTRRRISARPPRRFSMAASARSTGPKPEALPKVRKPLPISVRAVCPTPRSF